MMRDGAPIFGKNREDRNRGKTDRKDQMASRNWKEHAIQRDAQERRRVKDRAPFSGDAIDGKNKNQSEELSLHVTQHTSTSAIQKNQPAIMERTEYIKFKFALQLRVE